MMLSLARIIKFIIFFSSVVAAYYWGRNVTISEQLPLYESLRTTASIIFGVMGAWIALICPDMISTIVTVYTSSDKETYSRFRLLIKPMQYSTMIIVVILIVNFIVPLGRDIDVLVEYKEIVRGLSYALLCALTLLQIWSILLTFIPNDIVKTHVERKKSHQKMVSEYSKRNTKRR